MKKLSPRAASALLGAAFLLSPALVFAEEYTPFSVQTGGTGATTVEKAKENLGIPDVVQTAGSSEAAIMSQKAVTDAIAAGSGEGIVVTQASGQSTTNVMSQKAVTDALSAVFPPTVVQITGTSVSDIMSQKAVTDALNAVSQPTVVQTTGTSTSDIMSQKAVTDAISAVPQTTIVQTTGQSISSVMSQKAVTDSILTAQNILNMIYPVGAIYISVGSTSPGTLFGGTWEQIQDKFLLGAGSSHAASSTGGNETISLSISNIPGHTHDFSATTGGSGSHTHNVSISTDYTGNTTHAHNTRNSILSEGIGTNREGNYTTNLTSASASDHTHTVSGTTGSAGSGTAFSVMPPYLAVYMWKRTA